MKKVAVFGNTGDGKSTLARKLAEVTGLPLYPLDLIQYRVGGQEVPREEYLRAHAELLTRDAWIIDGYGCRTSAWERFACADTLIHVDLPLFTHFRWVTKRLLRECLTRARGMARRQSDDPQHSQQLPRAVAVSSAPDAAVSSARGRGPGAHARSPSAVARGHRRAPGDGASGDQAVAGAGL